MLVFTVEALEASSGSKFHPVNTIARTLKDQDQAANNTEFAHLDFIFHSLLSAMTMIHDQERSTTEQTPQPADAIAIWSLVLPK
jgi:hypothetical protein